METHAAFSDGLLSPAPFSWRQAARGLFADAPLLAWSAVGFALLSLMCLVAWAFDATPVLGLHPAVKPLKFSLSIAVYLVTLAALFPYLSTPRVVRTRFETVIVVTMVVEIVVIVGQALRGTTSHFNMSTPLDAVGWSAMGLAILVNSVAMAGLAVLATVRPLARGGRTPLEDAYAFAWRSGLWLFLFAVVSGFLMAQSSRHTFTGLADIGAAPLGRAADGGPGLPFVNWSTQAGDLRVSHFFALHALQAFPLAAFVFSRAWRRKAPALTRAFVGVYAAVCVVTFVQALSGVPLWSASVAFGQEGAMSSVAASGPSASLLSDTASNLLFQWANILVMPFWLLMILAPRWRVTARVMDSHLAPALPALVYAVLVIPSLSSLLPLLANPKPDVIGALLASPQGLAIAWLHFLAFDLFVGRFIWLRLKDAPLPTPALSVILVATLLFGPIGYLLFLVALTYVVRAEASGTDDEAAEIGAEKEAAGRGVKV